MKACLPDVRIAAETISLVCDSLGVGRVFR